MAKRDIRGMAAKHSCPWCGSSGGYHTHISTIGEGIRGIAVTALRLHKVVESALEGGATYDLECDSCEEPVTYCIRCDAVSRTISPGQLCPSCNRL
jgi:hypothetical protein